MNRYSNADLAIVGGSFFTEGGDWRSIYYYVRKAESKGRAIVLISLRAKRALRQLLAVWAFAPRVLVNALASFDSWLVLAMCMVRKDVCIYLHETEHALDGYQKAYPIRYLCLKRVLSRNPLLCVSDKAKDLYRARFGAAECHVVYECVGDIHGVPLDPSKVHIVNVGSLNERKGVELFGRVADLAQARHPEWKFHWIGGLATMNELYQSPAVEWHGFMWHPHEMVKQCDLFFLSSVDDPCPLSAIEAVQCGIPVVAYAKTGTAEIIEMRPDCGIYNDYSPEAALLALEKAVNSQSGHPIGGNAPHIVTVPKFLESVEKAVGLPANWTSDFG